MARYGDGRDKGWQAGALGAALLAAAGPTFGIDLGIEGVQLDGYLTQGYTRSSEYNFYGPSASAPGSLEFTEAGLAASWAPDPKLRLAGQLLYRRAGEMYPGSGRVDYLLLDYAPLVSEDLTAGVRLGRIKNPYGLYNQTRDVAFTRPSILLPQSIYLDGLGLRDFILSTDGLELYSELRKPWGTIGFEATWALPSEQSDVTKTAFFGGFPAAGDFRLEHGSFARLMYEDPTGQLRLGLTGVRIRDRYDPVPGDRFRVTDLPVDILMLSGQYALDQWTFTSEVAWRRVGTPVSEPGNPSSGLEELQLAYYLQAAYRFQPDWEAFVRYDALYNDLTDKSGERLAAALHQPPAPRYFARDWTVGVGWQPRPEMLLRAEYHRIDGTAWVPVQDNPGGARGSGERSWDLFALQFSYRF